MTNVIDIQTGEPLSPRVHKVFSDVQKGSGYELGEFVKTMGEISASNGASHGIYIMVEPNSGTPMAFKPNYMSWSDCYISLRNVVYDLEQMAFNKIKMIESLTDEQMGVEEEADLFEELDAAYAPNNGNQFVPD